MSLMLSVTRCLPPVTALALAAAFGASLSNAQGTIVQTLDAFHAPSAVQALPDRSTFLVTNTGRGEYGLTVGRGAISRVTLGSDGKLAVDQLRFIEGLNGPVGMTLLATGSETLPAGTLVVTVGGSWMVDVEGRPLADDAARGTGLVFFDPATGAARGSVLLGSGSTTESVLGHPVADLTAITSDPAGNVYVLDVDVAATRSSRRGEAKAGVIKIARAALDQLVRGETPPAGGIVFAAEPSVPTALIFSTSDESLYWGTFNGELRRLPQGDFSGQVSVVTVSKEAGTIACFAMTPNGEMVGAGSDGRLLRVKGRRVREIKFHRDPRFLSPGQPAVVRADDGRTLLLLPEQGAGGVGPWRQRVTVIALAGDF